MGNLVNETNEILPIGSIVYIKGALKKIMIIGRSITKEKDGVLYHFDYAGCLYPEGLVSEEIIFMNNEDISDLLARGHDDDDNKELTKRILKWKKETEIQKGNVNIFTGDENEL